MIDGKMEFEFIPKKKFMLRALEFAEEAALIGEVPVGAVVVYKDEIIGQGFNKREMQKSALAHAEIEAIQQACISLKSWRLKNCSIYVTLEPCPMCMGAILNARISRVIFGADDIAAGCCGTAYDFSQLENFQFPEIYKGFMEENGKQLLKAFFENLR